jgi:hypothetical protein
MHDEPDAPATQQEAAEIETVADAPEAASESASAPEPEPGTAEDEPETVTVARVSRVGMSLEEAADEFATEVAAGERISLRQIQTRCHTGMPRARTIQTHLTALMDAHRIVTVDAGTDEQARVRELVSL